MDPVGIRGLMATEASWNQPPSHQVIVYAPSLFSLSQLSNFDQLPNHLVALIFGLASLSGFISSPPSLTWTLTVYNLKTVLSLFCLLLYFCLGI